MRRKSQSRRVEVMRQNRQDYWAKQISEQEASGQTAQAFCRERGLCAHTFYHWRKRLLKVRRAPQFALVKAIGTQPPAATPASSALELIFVTGERLRIPQGADAAMLRLTLDALRA